MKQTRIILVIIILIATAGFAIWALQKAPISTTENSVPVNQVINNDQISKNEQSSSTNSETPKNNQIITKNENRLEISSKQTGRSLIVDDFNLNQDGFIVVFSQPVKAGAKPISSSKLIKSGSGQDLIISGSYQAKIQYLARLYIDNGDGKFNSGDMIVTDSNNQPIERPFSF